jgi:hypothetical protein
MWFVRVVERQDEEAKERKQVQKVRNALAVFLSEPLSFSQGTLELGSERYEDFYVHATAFLVRGDGWVKVSSSRDFRVSNGRLSVRFTDLKRGDQVRIIVYIETGGDTLPDPSGLTFKVL